MYQKICNMHYYFNRTYYESINQSNFSPAKMKDQKFNNDLIAKYTDYKNIDLSLNIKLQSIIGKVTYPGLLIGSGNNHEIGAKGEINMGFSFDYVTGLPYIPGSSLKGVLLKGFVYEDYILEKLGLNDIKSKTDFINLLKEDIFGSDKKFGKDTFFDSYVINYSGEEILKVDNLAPHRQNKKLLTLGEVNILTMLCLKPGTEIELRFKLNDSALMYENKKYDISISEKLTLFKEIISDFGIGAKTNVGYGYLSDLR